MKEVLTRIEIYKGDITKESTDAIVNASNNSLSSGSGVNGAIHAAAGPALLEECLTLGGCETGHAKITKGYDLHARFVIHTVGPVWHGGKQKEAELLAACYINSLKLAVAKGLQTIAFPNISTGIFGYPKKEAAEVALHTCIDFLKNDHQIRRLVFMCFDDENYDIYSQKLEALRNV